MWLSALPWIFIAIRSMLNASPGPTSAPNGCFIPCWTGSGLSAAGWCSTGAASDTCGQSDLAHGGTHFSGRDAVQRSASVVRSPGQLLA